jgi:putative DNA-invertase from lambdoid prophage Rac
MVSPCRLFNKLRAGDVLVVRWVDRLKPGLSGSNGTQARHARRGDIGKHLALLARLDGSPPRPVDKGRGAASRIDEENDRPSGHAR